MGTSRYILACHQRGREMLLASGKAKNAAKHPVLPRRPLQRRMIQSQISLKLTERACPPSSHTDGFSLSVVLVPNLSDIANNNTRQELPSADRCHKFCTRRCDNILHTPGVPLSHQGHSPREFKKLVHVHMANLRQHKDPPLSAAHTILYSTHHDPLNKGGEC